MTRPPTYVERILLFALGAWLADLGCRWLMVNELRREMRHL